MEPLRKRRRSGVEETATFKFQLTAEEQHVCFDRFLALYEENAMCDVVLRVYRGEEEHSATSTTPALASFASTDSSDQPSASSASPASAAPSPSSEEGHTEGAEPTAHEIDVQPHVCGGGEEEANEDGGHGDGGAAEAPFLDFHAHKCVLASYPSFLSSILRTPMAEGQQQVVVLRYTEPRQFKVLLDYIYGKPVEMPSTEVVNILELADRYQVSGLRTKAETVLRRSLDARNCATILHVGDVYACHELRQQAFTMLVSNFALATKSSDFLNLQLALVKEIIASDQIKDCDEATVFSAVIRWVNHAPSSRLVLLDDLLQLVRFPLMDASFLSAVVKPHPMMRSPSARDLIIEAFEHQALVAAGETVTLAGHSDAVSALTVCGGKLVSGAWDMTVCVWDADTLALDRTISNHTGPVMALAVVAGRLVSASADATIMVWNPDSWALVRTLEGHEDQVNCVIEFGDRLVSGSEDGTIKLWSSHSWSCELTLHHEQQANGVLCLAVCGQRLLSGTAKDESNATIQVWNTQNWACERVIEAHTDSVWALVVADCPDGAKLVSASVDQTLHVWDTDTWTSQQVLTGHSGPVYALTTMEGKIVSGSHDETVVVWAFDAADGCWKRERELRTEGVWALTVWNDRLVGGLCDNSIKVWR